MYVFLVILGALVALGGVVIALPGLPFEGREFDATIITPGAVALVGGLILIGLGLAVRVLSRIEKALAMPLPLPTALPLMPHSAIQDEATVAAAAAEQAAAPPPPPAQIPIPPRPVVEPRPQPAQSAPAAAALPEDAALERLREKFPTLVRLDAAPVVEDADVSLMPKPLRAEEEAGEVNTAVAARANGAAAPKIAPRLEVASRQPGRIERPRSFDAFWPKKQRQLREQAREAQAAVPATPPAPAIPQTAAPAQPVEPVLVAESEQFKFREAAAEPQAAPPPPAAVVPEPPVPVSILKSGVVDGMAYTLYSDGSIEAQLPQGTLRFGSIAELRSHIEQSA
jgi:hypothetical protein